jgi:hypothetical protein
LVSLARMEIHARQPDISTASTFGRCGKHSKLPLNKVKMERTLSQHFHSVLPRMTCLIRRYLLRKCASARLCPGT